MLSGCFFRRAKVVAPFLFAAVLGPASAIDTPYTLHQGAVYSTSQSATQSHLRFYNAGAGAGTVKVTLTDAAGAALVQWTSPSIPAGAAAQFYIGEIEAGATKAYTKPALYGVAIDSQMPGRFQHVLYRPADGTITNLSTCDVGVGASPTVLTNVHTSTLDYGFPSSVVVGNTAAAATAVTLGIYNGVTGEKLGTYTTAAIPPGAQAIVGVAEMEAAARITVTGSMYHYVIKAETSFTGFLQHLVNNTKVGVTTDMTTTCSLAYTPPPLLTAVRQGAVVSSAQPGVQSHLRFYNGGKAAGTVKVTLSDRTSGAALGQWTSPSIPAGAANQFYIGEIEDGARVAHKPDYYTVTVQPQFAGMYQHVLYRPADGTITNLSTCDTGVGASTTVLTHVHTSTLDYGFPSSVLVGNTGVLARAVTLGLYEVRSGTRLGLYTTPSIVAGGEAVIAVADMEKAAGIVVTPDMYHYIVKVETPFTGFLQHIVNNIKVGVTTDMTTTCGMQGATFGELKPAIFSASLPVTPVKAIKSDNPNSSSALAYLLASSYGWGNLFGNGRNDLIVAPSYRSQRPAIPIAFWRNNGDGTFTDRTADVMDEPITTEGVGNVFVSDLNGDGRDDVFMVDTGWELPGAAAAGTLIGGVNRLLLSGADGKLHDASSTLPQTTRAYNHRSTMVDFNGDGCQDFIITELGGVAIIPTFGTYILLGDCKGHFTKMAGLPPGVTQKTRGQTTPGLMPSLTVGVYHSTAADLNGDGKLELITGGTNQDDATRGVRIYDGATGLAEVARLVLPPYFASITTQAGPSPVSIVPYDVDGDGKKDLILHMEQSGSTKFWWLIFRNKGDYKFEDVTLQYVASYEVSSLSGGTGNMRKAALRQVAPNQNQLQIECGQSTLVDLLTDGKCLFNFGTSIKSWRPTVGGRAVTAADLPALAPARSWICPVQGGTELIFDVDGDGVDDLVLVNGMCPSPATAEYQQMTSSLQTVVFLSGPR